MKAASRSVIRGISCGKLRFFEAAGGREGAGEAARLGIFCRGRDLVGDPRELHAWRSSAVANRWPAQAMFQNGGRGRGGGGFRGGRGSGRGAGRERSLHSGGRNLYHGEPAQSGAGAGFFGGRGGGRGDGGRGGGRGDGRGGGGRGFGGGRGNFGGGRGGYRDAGGRGGGGWVPQVPLSERNAEADRVDAFMGYHKLDKTETGGVEIGWCSNMRTVLVEEEEGGAQRSAVEYYFIRPDGSGFKAWEHAEPYFYLAVQPGYEGEVESALRRKFATQIKELVYADKEDLALPNHLSGLKKRYLQLRFESTRDLMDVRRLLLPVVQRNRAKRAANAAYAAMQSSHADGAGGGRQDNWLERVEDVREYDVPYHQRVAIDTGRRVGKWYAVKEEGAKTIIDEMADRKAFADPRVYAFDIECCKQPLKFPDANSDPIMMISYMMDGRGFLIINREVRARAPLPSRAAALATPPSPSPARAPRLPPLPPPTPPLSRQVVSEDIDSFEYTPKPEFPGPFTVFNETDELATLKKWCAVTCARLEHRGSGDTPRRRSRLSLPPASHPRRRPPPATGAPTCASCSRRWW
jgi:DNA polymerase epsilon subunit 1